MFEPLLSEMTLFEVVSVLDELGEPSTELEPDPEPAPGDPGLLWGWLGGGVVVTGSVYCSSPALWASAVEGTSRSASRTR